VEGAADAGIPHMVSMTGMNEGSVADSAWSERMACKISQIIMQLIVVGRTRPPREKARSWCTENY